MDVSKPLSINVQFEFIANELLIGTIFPEVSKAWLAIAQIGIDILWFFRCLVNTRLYIYRYITREIKAQPNCKLP